MKIILVLNILFAFGIFLAGQWFYRAGPVAQQPAPQEPPKEVKVRSKPGEINLKIGEANQ